MPKCEVAPLFNADSTANNGKSFEIEAESNGKRVLLVCYVPNITKSTKEAKEELLNKQHRLFKSNLATQKFI